MCIDMQAESHWKHLRPPDCEACQPDHRLNQENKRQAHILLKPLIPKVTGAGPPPAKASPAIQIVSVKAPQPQPPATPPPVRSTKRRASPAPKWETARKKRELEAKAAERPLKAVKEEPVEEQEDQSEFEEFLNGLIRAHSESDTAEVIQQLLQVVRAGVGLFPALAEH